MKIRRDAGEGQSGIDWFTRHVPPRFRGYDEMSSAQKLDASLAMLEVAVSRAQAELNLSRARGRWRHR
jgi:hypothetical protein